MIKSLVITGSNCILSIISLSKLIPGAISIKKTWLFLILKTHRSVIINISCPYSSCNLGENVISSTVCTALIICGWNIFNHSTLSLSVDAIYLNSSSSVCFKNMEKYL